MILQEELNSQEVQLCKDWIAKFTKKRKTINTDISSYGLKHAVEQWAKEYVSNEAFIKAAIDSAFEYKNCYFNMEFPKRGTSVFREAFGS